VAPRTEPIAAIVQDGETGLLFHPEKPSELSAQIARLIASPEERARLGTAAQQVIRERHTWRRNAEALLAAVRPR
jgi:glycosyltransferase involved in cell wall biosynthesis